MDKVIVSYPMTICGVDEKLNCLQLENEDRTFLMPIECFNFNFVLNNKILYQVKERYDGTRYFMVSPIKDT